MKFRRYGIIALTLVFALLIASGPAYASTNAQQKADESLNKAIVVSQHSPEKVSPATPDIKQPEMKMGMCSQCCCSMASGGKCKPGKMMKPMLSGDSPPMKHKMMMKKMKCMQKQEDCRGAGYLLSRAEELKLTDEQKAKIEKMRLNTKLALVDLKAALTKEKIKLKKLIMDEAKISKIKSQMEAVLRAEMDLKLKKITAKRDVQQILTKEQKEKLKSLKPMHGMMGMDAGEPEDVEEIEIILDDEDSGMHMSKMSGTNMDCCR